MNVRTVLILLAWIVAFLRPFFIAHEFNRHVSMSYQAVAHILVGILIANWYLTGDKAIRATFWGLVAVEVICATVSFLT